MLDLPEQFILFDTEFTAWEGSQARGWSGPNEYRELVEIGAIKIASEDLAEFGAFDVFIRPERNPVLSDYFIQLTGITQATVDAEGVELETALRDFKDWCGGLPLYSYGTDEQVLIENCALQGVSFPFPVDQFSDVRTVFQRRGIPAERYMSSTIVRAFDMEPARRAHRALNDARTILDGLRLLAVKR
ncbi:MAG: 3'-5' exonuclease [bacterium]|nr:3'-5' exonuclease [bacterium]